MKDNQMESRAPYIRFVSVVKLYRQPRYVAGWKGLVRDELMRQKTVRVRTRVSNIPCCFYSNINIAFIDTPSDVSYWSECDELESSDPPEVPETHRTICKRSETVPNKVKEETDNDPVRNRLESIVRYRQSSSDSPVSSLRDLYRQQDLPSLLGSLEIDDVLVGMKHKAQIITNQINANV